MTTLHSLAQLTSGNPDLSSAILYSAGLIVVGVMGWVITVTRKVEKAVTRLTDYLFGYGGDNGVRSQISQLEADVRVLLLALERRSGPAERRIPPP